MRELPLKYLDITHIAAKDLTPLHELPLATLVFNKLATRKGIDGLRGMRSLRRVGIHAEQIMAAVEFWRRFDAGEFKGK